MGVNNQKFSVNIRTLESLSRKVLMKTRNLGLSLALICFLSISNVRAGDQTKLVNIFSLDNNSIIFETEDKKQIKNFDLLKSKSGKYKLVFNDVDIDEKLIRNFNKSQTKYQIKKEKIKESFFQKRQVVSVEVDCSYNCNADFQPLLGGLAYKLDLAASTQSELGHHDFVPIAKLDLEHEDFTKEVQVIKTSPVKLEPIKLVEEPVQEERKEVVIQQEQEEKSFHLLQANKKDQSIFILSSEASPVEEFLDDLDESLVNEIMSQQTFRKENIAKADSASLSHLAQKLKDEGHQDLSVNAYMKAIEVDPKNLNAMLGLARTTANQDEKLQYYLKAVDDEALVEIGQSWFKKGMASGDQKQIAQAMISYQFAVLKNPQNPYYRYEYGQVLEESGYGNFEEASKRYLEAAVLAKRDFKAGDNHKEDILRKSTECLIKVLTKQGAADKAVHYCNSYIGLGFKKFLDGRSIKGVMKEIGSNKNPFRA